MTKGEETLQALTEQLREYFEPYVQVDGFTVDGRCEALTGYDYVLTTSRIPEIYGKARQLIKDDTPLIVIHRLFEPSKIKLLMQIPAGTEVLVINNLRGTSTEVIETLKDANIDHLNYVPFYPGCDLGERTYRYAITLGTPELLPPFPVELIDIGIRKLHIYDLIHIGRALDIPLERERRYVFRFISDMHELGKQLGKEYIHARNLHYHLTSTFEAVKEPIIAVDKEMTVTFVNSVAVELFGWTDQDVIGQSLDTLDGGDKISSFFNQTDDQPIDEHLIQIKDRQYVVNCEMIKEKNKLQGYVCVLKNVTEIQRLERQLRNVLKDKGHVATYSFSDIIGKSRALKEKIHKAKKMAAYDRSVLITGENGTGKELFAHAIHLASPRKSGPFVAINCASLPENLLESEIFGYEPGAFTGARKEGKPGVFEQADGGTIFLDEIGSISPAIQVRLLRVLQEKEVIRVGGTRVLSVDVRVIAATNTVLENAVTEGTFREDLYYRLNVLPIKIPPLRERTEDIPLLIEHYLKKLGENKTIDSAVLDLFVQYPWPGNIRELINVIEYAVTVSDGALITLDHIPEQLTVPSTRLELPPPLRTDEGLRDLIALPLDDLDMKILTVLEAFYHSQQVVGRYSLSQVGVLRDLGLTEQRLRTRLKKLEKLGLVDIGTTRQGTKITEKGMACLKNQRIG